MVLDDPLENPESSRKFRAYMFTRLMAVLLSNVVVDEGPPVELAAIACSLSSRRNIDKQLVTYY